MTARPGSARPDNARPGSARPDNARPGSSPPGSVSGSDPAAPARRTGLRGLTWDHPRGYVVLDAVAATGGEPPSPGDPSPGDPPPGDPPPSDPPPSDPPPSDRRPPAPRPISNQISLNTPNGENPPPAEPIRWERQPLEGFESRPLRTLADDYDLLVIDHPGLGEAIRDGALRPLDTLLPAEELAAMAAVSAGRSFASYRLAGHQWALPLDAAAQVSVCRPDLMDERPLTWEDARRAARRHRTVLCLGGPHALLMFAAICVALGAPPGAAADDVFADPATGAAALDIMADLFAHADHRLPARNPIAVLDAMATSAALDSRGARKSVATPTGAPAYCPLVYGYLTYQRPRPGHATLAAFDAPAGQHPASPGHEKINHRGAGDAPAIACPAAEPERSEPPRGERLPGDPTPGATTGHRIGSVLGGTGIAVTRSCARPEAAVAHISRLLSEQVQVGLYAELGGQSADRRAWADAAADASSGGFYSATRRTVEAAWVRPRFPGYLGFQAAASAMLRDGLIEGERHDLLLRRINDLYAAARAASGQRSPTDDDLRSHNSR